MTAPQDEQSAYEERFATGFLRERKSIGSPDLQRPSLTSGRKTPDFVCLDITRPYAVEVTRLMPKYVRELQFVLDQHVCGPLRGLVRGTFTLQATLPAAESYLLTKGELARLASEAATEYSRDPDAIEHELGGGFSLVRNRTHGSQVVPWLMQEELPTYPEQTPLYNELLRLTIDAVLEAGEKFAAFDGNRILLIDASQANLDLNVHSSAFESSLRKRIPRLVGHLDEVWFGQYSVWSGRGPRVLTGHRYIDADYWLYERIV